MTALRQIDQLESETHAGEVFACSYSPAGNVAVSAGWDGCLRLWETGTGGHLTSLRVGVKPLSACTFTPDGRRLIAGSMEGLVSTWDAHTHQPLSNLAVHTRPVSCVRFSPDGNLLASTSWDRSLSLRKAGHDRDAKTITIHDDIINGCRFSPDGSFLLTWSCDRTLRLWDVETLKEQSVWRGHRDRVTTADLSPDGLLAASGSRLGELILWDVEARQTLHAVRTGAEVRGCFFLLDGAELATLDAQGRVTIYSVPDLQLQVQIALRHPAQCGALSPSGTQLAVGGEDGLVRLVALEDIADRPLMVTTTRSVRHTASRFQRLTGRSSTVPVFACTCPACGRPVEFLHRLPTEPAPCPHCRRVLRVNRKTVVGTAEASA